MYKTQDEIKKFCEVFNKLINNDHQLKRTDVVIAIAPTYVGLIPFKTHNKTNTIAMAQNTNDQNNGAYTSEISYAQLKDIGVTTVLIGHSEVRSHLHENDESINRKILSLLKADMTPVLCIGETLHEFENGQTNAVLRKQLTADLQNIDVATVQRLIIAYEPI
jgi:triosephosphate isomerase